ncbi:Aste57867_23513 [Aphanomyces stellatus]|uniref:Aste57867_23513 protein n=1 Tax=Aphanomyces stellatus TaxID=120398 RepID=A0A485LN97_9STRA|nr:hypothetical protein As57867_023442 [Aphanomyces stellatus]VFU00158.1 Aste57867_23513 [Aphanomyces stellatus]
MAEPSSKKLKADTPVVLHPGLVNMTADERREIKDIVLSNAPFPHYQIPALCTPEHMLKVHTECVEELQSTFKETDLFKLYQTIDLANLKLSDPLATKLPALMQLRNALVDICCVSIPSHGVLQYTTAFRSLIADIMGCGPLTDKVDCAANVYMSGCHLLPHDDVIGTRCISYVIYLSDPEDEWKAEDGGALELFPAAEPGIPALVPTTFVLPSYNTLALFRVEPGVSFHSVQEVYADKPRLSIQGWFHQESAPDGVEQATQRQLAAMAATVAPFDPLSNADDDDEDDLSTDDIDYLKTFINDIYLSAPTIAQIQRAFQQTGSLQLQDFLIPAWADAIAAATRRDDATDHLGHGHVPAYTAGYGPDWAPQGPLYHQRYLRFVGPGASSPSAAASSGALLGTVQSDLVRSDAFSKWLAAVSGVGLSGVRSEVRRFRAGLDYTLAHAPDADHAILDAVVCFCDPGKTRHGDAAAGDDDAQSTWQTGFECYMAAKDDGVGDVAADDDENGVQIEAQHNTLSLVVRDTHTIKFVKFISAREPGSRWDVHAEFCLAAVAAADDDDDDKGDEGDEAA